MGNSVMKKWITTIDYPFPSTRLIDIVISTQTKKKKDTLHECEFDNVETQSNSTNLNSL